MNSIITVNKEKCIKCGLCVDVCPAKMLVLENEEPVAAHNDCYSCGQCVAVCPRAAINNVKTPLSEQTEANGKLLSPEDMECLLKSRRSIRRYQKKRVSCEVVERLVA